MATIISFTVSGLKEKALNKIATANGMTPNEYVEDKMTIHLEEQARGYYQSKFNLMTIVEIYNLFGDIT